MLSVGQGGALVLAAWLSGLSARDGLLIGAVVPAAAVPLALLLIPRVPDPAVPGTGVEAGSPEAVAAATPAEAPAPAPPAAAAPAPAPSSAGRGMSPDRSERANHRLFSIGHVGEWGPLSPSRAHHLLQRRRPLAGLSGILGGGFGWVLAAWIPAYAGSAVVFSLYPLLFQHAFGVAPQTSALAFAVIVFVSLPLFVLAGAVSQQRGPAVAMAGAFGARVLLLAALAVLAAVGHVIGSVAGGLAAGRWRYPVALALGAGATGVGLTVFATTVLPRRDGLWPLRRMAERESTGPAGPKNP